MGKEVYVKTVGGISFLLASGLLISSGMFLASTKEFSLDTPKHNIYAKRNHKGGSGRSELPQFSRVSRKKRYYNHKNGNAEILSSHYRSDNTGQSQWPQNSIHHTPTTNSKLRMFNGLAITGIIISIFQVSASFLGCCATKKTGRRLSILWMFTNMIIVIGLIIIFALSMYYYRSCLSMGLSKGAAHKEWLAFTVTVFVNAFLSVALISYSYFALKRKHYEYEKYATTTDNSSHSDERQKLTNVYTSNVRAH
ncbi:unnamed protein product [Allacma fusca]|uniref:Uncharacterized protein n=1 Tax=Allacma fusca TaxID=39272 RepID=A0A8J2PGY6_9HEXA|nr:unnamed protein product [Allacma fusca]